MTSITELVDDDLTSDACPTPSLPKGEVNRARVLVEECEDIIENVHQIPPRPNKVTSARKPKKARKPNIPSVANVINIANCNGVQIGQNYTITMAKSDKKDRFKETIVKTDAIYKLLECKKPVTREHIDFVATHAGEGWRDIGRNLNYSEGQIYQFLETHSIKGVKEVIYNLLLDWIQNESDQATIAVLTQTLWNSGQENVAKMLSERIEF